MWRRAAAAALPRPRAERRCATEAAPPSGTRPGSFLRDWLQPGLVGGVSGALATYAVLSSRSQDSVSTLAEDRRKRLPKRIILVRHGESEGNADHSLYRSTGDNLIELTPAGSLQAQEAGRRIKGIIGEESVHIFVSPFERTLQTSRNVREAFDSQIKHTYVEPRIREQEFGNLQGHDFKRFREEQQRVGRFWYRFPEGESGADVYDRVKNWWDDTLLEVNTRHGHQHVENVVVITHGLTMRLVLMQLYGWSPNTFHTVWNARNCAVYVLVKDLSIRGDSPYRLDESQGDTPESSITVGVTFKRQAKRWLELKNYLSLPQPRTRQYELAKEMLAEQHGLDPGTIAHIDFFGGKFKRYR
mmetsp:Transcript_76342/g.210753  ORF Transcript_76342/g.210753 Transcript_76342/m.210753 type:complete len:358 (+) Transcript_76342:98-1171(+)